MAEIIVSRKDAQGNDANEELEFEFKKEKGEVKATAKARKKNPRGDWGPPVVSNAPGAQFGESRSGKKGDEFIDGQTTVYNKDGAIVIQVNCPDPGDKVHKPFITFGGTPYNIDHHDQDRLKEALKGLDLPKKP